MQSRRKLRKANDRLVVSWTVKFEVVARNKLAPIERRAVRAALHEQKLSVNPKFQVGAAAVSYDGMLVSYRNDVVGPNWHAEQRVLSNLYAKICWAKPCGKCLEFIHDCTANVRDVDFLSVAETGQVIRTSLRSLITAPHTSLRVPVRRVGKVWRPVPSTSGNKHDPHGSSVNGNV